MLPIVVRGTPLPPTFFGHGPSIIHHLYPSDRLEPKPPPKSRSSIMLPIICASTVVNNLEIPRRDRRVTVIDVAKATAANRNTGKDHLWVLTDEGNLALHGAGRTPCYGQT
jgi:hypothetical protein